MTHFGRSGPPDGVVPAGTQSTRRAVFAQPESAREDVRYVPTQGARMNDKGMLIMTTVDSEEAAAALAGSLLERRLAACVQEVRINSRYRWQGELESDAEILLLVKTSKQATAAAMDLIRDIHSYEVPEIIAVPISAGLPAYLEWLDAEADG